MSGGCGGIKSVRAVGCAGGGATKRDRDHSRHAERERRPVVCLGWASLGLGWPLVAVGGVREGEQPEGEVVCRAASSRRQNPVSRREAVREGMKRSL